MIERIKDKHNLNEFICFVKTLYKNDKYYVCPIFYSLKKELTELVLNKKAYVALLSKDETGKVNGRLLYTIDNSKQLKKQIGYFSFFESKNDVNIAKDLFSYMEDDLKSKGITNIEGTFSPYDPDTRRGILVKGFDKPHTILTSYNFDYYGKLLEAVGYTKSYDTFTLSIPLTDKFYSTTEKLSKFFLKTHNTVISNIDLNNPENDIDAVYSIFKEATNEVNYQEPPSREMISSFLKGLKFFVQPKIVKIAREKETNRPIGFCFSLPDYNQIFKKTKGKINIFKLLRGKNHLTSARGMLQYVVPEYQKTGLLYQIYYELFKSFKELGITTFEGGTILEENTASWNQLVKLGGSVDKIYRIYGKEI